MGGKGKGEEEKKQECVTLPYPASIRLLDTYRAITHRASAGSRAGGCTTRVYGDSAHQADLQLLVDFPFPFPFPFHFLFLFLFPLSSV